MYSSEGLPAPRTKSPCPLQSFQCRKILQLSRVTAKKTRGAVLPKRDDRCTFVCSRDTTAVIMIESSVTMLLEYLQTSHFPLGRSSVMANWNEKINARWKVTNAWRSSKERYWGKCKPLVNWQSLTQTKDTCTLLQRFRTQRRNNFRGYKSYLLPFQICSLLCLFSPPWI